MAGAETGIAKLRRLGDQRINLLETERLSWWATWSLLQRYQLPRGARLLPLQNPGNRGSRKDHHILNSTATLSAQRFGAGMLAGASSPARPWFGLKLVGEARGRSSGGKSPSVRPWLDECTQRMMRVFAESNFYRALGQCYEQLGVFGTSTMMIYEDFEDVIRCYPQVAGEYYLANDHRLDASTLARKVAMTVDEIVGKFGLAACSDSVQRMFRDNNREREIIVCHLIEPNDRRIADAPGARGMPWREIWWEWGLSEFRALRIRGFHEKPFSGARWNVTSNDAYGHGCGMDCLGDTMQIQRLELRNAECVDKTSKPPLKAPALLENSPMSQIPGGVTFMPQGVADAEFAPLFQIDPRAIPAIQAEIQRCEKRVESSFFNDLFLMIANDDRDMTAFEVAKRQEEKMLMLGPPLERMHAELLAVAVERTFGIMTRAKLFPPAPAELHGQHLAIEFVSILAQAQRAVATTAIERVFSFAGSIAALKPEVMDNLDADKAIDTYADLLGAPSSIVVEADAVAKTRQARAQAQQQQASLSTGLAAAQGAQTLSKTDVGGGQNALQAMVGREAA